MEGTQHTEQTEELDVSKLITTDYSTYGELTQSTQDILNGMYEPAVLIQDHFAPTTIGQPGDADDDFSPFNPSFFLHKDAKMINKLSVTTIYLPGANAYWTYMCYRNSNGYSDSRFNFPTSDIPTLVGYVRKVLNQLANTSRMTLIPELQKDSTSALLTRKAGNRFLESKCTFLTPSKYLRVLVERNKKYDFIYFNKTRKAIESCPEWPGATMALTFAQAKVLLHSLESLFIATLMGDEEDWAPKAKRQKQDV